MTNSFLFSLLSFYAILVLVNIPAPWLGIKFDNEKSPLRFAPPGFVIPIAWFILFTLLAIARHQLLLANFSSLQPWLYALAVLCATYAYYTLGLARLTGISALWFGLWGNLAVIALASCTVIKLYPASGIAASLTAPIILWTSFATLIVVGEMKLQKLL